MRHTGSTKAEFQVLLVDDNPGDARLIQELLIEAAPSQFGVEHADRLSNGLERVLNGGLAAILLDLSLPDSHGLETITRMYTQAPTIPILVLTGLDDEKLGLEAVQHGAQDYLIKGQIDGQLLARSIRYAIERKRAEVETQQHTEAVQRMVEAQLTMITVDPDKMAQAVLDALQYALGIEQAGFFAYDAEIKILTLTRAVGFPPEVLQQTRPHLVFRLGDERGLVGMAAATSQPIYLPDCQADPRWILDNPTIRSAYFVPMVFGGRLFGVVSLLSFEPNAFSSHLRALANLFGQYAAVAMESARLLSETRKAEQKYRTIFDNAIEGIFQTTIEGRYITANPALARILGYDSPEEAVEALSDPAYQVYVDPNRRAEFKNLMNQQSAISGFVSQVYRKDGGIVWITENARAIRDHNGTLLYYEGTVEEITERKLAEQALRESEENFRLMFDNNPLAMWVYDLVTLRFLEVNEAATTRYGYSRDEFLQLKISDIRPSEDVPRLIQDVANTRPDLQLTNQWRHLLKNGQIIDVEISSHTLLFDERPAVLVVAKDITARKRAVEGLRESEARYRNLIETSPDAITFVDLEGTILLCNQQAATMLGYESPAQLVGRSSFDVIAPEDLPIAIRDMQSILQDGTMKNREYTLLRNDGSRFPAEVNGSSVPDAEGRPRGFVSIMRDITERKQAEDALAASEAELRALFAAMTDVVLVFDAQGRYLQIAPTNPDLLYKPAAELLGRTIHEVLPAPEAEEYLTIIGLALEKQEPIHFEYSLPIGDGLIWFDGTVSPMGKDKVFWLARDVTESKRTEEERRAREAAEEANQAKSAFLSRMSHELRTPLNSILGFAQLLKMDELTSEQYDSLNYIIKGGRHLLDLINEVLDIARIEAGRMSISLEPVLLQEVLEECLSLVQQMAADRRLGLHTDTLVASHLHVTADRQRLKQVLLNLLANAIKYNREGGSVSLSCREGLDGWLCIDVTDTGPGIPADKLDRLFSPFERLGAEQGDVEGTGLGLALSKGLITAMGGSIGVDSTPGNGSTFWVRLPITEGQLQRQERLTTVAPVSDKLTTTARTILYIEDNLSNLRLIERILERTPEIRVVSAMQGGLGLDLARQHCPDLILLDLNLPDMAGNEVLRHLREDPNTCDIPVVMVSADATSQQRERLLAAGAQAYLTKPLDVAQLIQILRQMLSERAS